MRKRQPGVRLQAAQDKTDQHKISIHAHNNPQHKRRTAATRQNQFFCREALRGAPNTSLFYHQDFFQL
jgi:hypothetical protein